MLGLLTRLAAFAVQARWRRDAEALDFARRLTWDAAARLKRYAATGPLTLPVVSLEELVGDLRIPWRVTEGATEDGGLSPFEALCTAAVTRHVQPRCIFEFGTFKGRTTTLLARHAPPDAHVSTLDLPSDQTGALPVRPNAADLHLIHKPRVGEYIAGSDVAHKIGQLFGDSRQCDFTRYYGRCDLVFVDAAHSFPFVVRDTANAFQMLAPGGVILWHDYRESCAGVVRALHEVAQSTPLQHIAHTSLVAFGLPRQRPTRHVAPAARTLELAASGPY